MLVISRSYKSYTDEQLLDPIKKGNGEAFDEIYSRYGQKMFSYFFRMLWKDQQLAEDFTQDLFLKLIKSISVFEENRSFQTWLYSIANNMCKNEYRKVVVRTKHQEMKSTSLGITDAINPDLRRFKDAVHNCTAELPDEKRSLFILRFQENLPVAEISKVLGIPEGTVKSRIFYLLKEMKDKLKEFETIHLYP